MYNILDNIIRCLLIFGWFQNIHMIDILYFHNTIEYVNSILKK